MSNYAPTVYVGNGTTTTWNIGWEFLDPSHVKVTVNGQPASYTLNISAGSIVITPAVSAGQTIRISRLSPGTEQVQFLTGQLKPTDITYAYKHTLFRAEEQVVENNTAEAAVHASNAAIAKVASESAAVSAQNSATNAETSATNAASAATAAVNSALSTLNPVTIAGVQTITGAKTFGKITLNGKPLIQAKGAPVVSAVSTDIWAADDGDSFDMSFGTGPIQVFTNAPQTGASKRINFTNAVTFKTSSLLKVPDLISGFTNHFVTYDNRDALRAYVTNAAGTLSTHVLEVVSQKGAPVLTSYWPSSTLASSGLGVGIPDWAIEATVCIRNAAVTVASNPILRLGSASEELTGYEGSTSYSTVGSQHSVNIPLCLGTTVGSTLNATIVLRRVPTTNAWIISGTSWCSAVPTFTQTIMGLKTITGGSTASVNIRPGTGNTFSSGVAWAKFTGPAGIVTEA